MTPARTLLLDGEGANLLLGIPLSGTFASGFSLDLMAKDLATAAELAEELGVPVPLAERCVALWKDAAAQLGRGADHTEIYRFLEQLKES